MKDPRRPLIVAGIKIVPRWGWSEEYRYDVKAHGRGVAESDITTQEMRRRYVVWYAEKFGLTFTQAWERLEVPGLIIE